MFKKCSEVVELYDKILDNNVKNHKYREPENPLVNKEYVTMALQRFSTNYIFDYGFKVRNVHNLINTKDQGLTLCQCPYNMTHWMKKVMFNLLFVNESEEFE